MEKVTKPVPPIPRALQPIIEKSGKSILLLGPRQTGKSTLMCGLKPDLYVNLAHEPTYFEFARNPKEIEHRIHARGSSIRTVLIDEIQRLPGLLNTVQTILDAPGSPKLRFWLTGSSARKLKRGHANLLPGRVHAYNLGPLTLAEVGRDLDIKQALSIGLLPGIWTDASALDQQKTLRTYGQVYLREEIRSESVVRNIEGFARLLDAAAADAGKILDLGRLSSEAAVPRQTAVRFFEILEDTLIVRRCEAFTHSARRRLSKRPKYYFFDTGVLNGLLGNFEVSSDRIGALFEHFLHNQMADGAASRDRDIRISSYRTDGGAEVDFIVEWNGRVIAVEAKASTNVSSADLRGLKSFDQFYGKKCEPAVVYLGDHEKRIDGIDILPWKVFLSRWGF